MNPLQRLIATGTHLIDAGMSEIEALIVQLFENDEERAADGRSDSGADRAANIEDRVASLDDEFERLQPEGDVAIVSPPPTGDAPAVAIRTSGGSFADAPDMTVVEVPAGAAAEDKPAAQKTTAKKPAAKKTPAKKSPAKKSPAKKSPAKKPSAKKTPAKKSPANKSGAKKTPAKKTPAKKSPAKKTPAKKTSAQKSAAKKSPSQKTVAKRPAGAKTSAPPPNSDTGAVGASGVAPILTTNPNRSTQG